MFAQHSILIDRPVEEVSAALAAAPGGWLPSLIGPSPSSTTIAGFGLRKKVSIKLGEPMTDGRWTEIPISWQASYIMPLMHRVAEATVKELAQTVAARLEEASVT